MQKENSTRASNLKTLIVELAVMLGIMATSPLWFLPMCWYLLGDVPEHKDGTSTLMVIMGGLCFMVMTPFYILCIMELL
jgi:hypothetical protein